MTAELLKRRPALDCICFSNDDLAFGSLCHCIASGIEVPGDVALAGFDGLGIVEGFPGKIATSWTACKKIGEKAARVVLETFGTFDCRNRQAAYLEARNFTWSDSGGKKQV